MKRARLGLLCLLAGVVLTACKKEKEILVEPIDDTTTTNYKGEEDYKETLLNLNLDMVYVQGGMFDMGATVEQGDDALGIETPAHKVTLSSYHIGKYEITQAQWKVIMGTTIQQQLDKYYEFYGDGGELFEVGDNYPMYYVNWFDAKEFCDKLSQKTGKKYVLPTEAQWEFSARGGNKSKGYKYSGSNTLGDVAWL